MSMPDVSAQRHSTVKTLVVCFVVSVIVSILSVFVWVTWQSYDQHIREGEGNVANLARAAAQHAEDAVREIDAVSAGVLKRIEWYGIDSMDKERLRTVFKKRSDLMPQIHGFFVYDKDGNWLLTDKDSIPASANNSDRDYFIYHRAHPGDREMHVSKVVKSRSTGDYVVPLSRRIDNPDGSFAGVFLVTMSIEYFNQYYAGFHLDDNGIFLISLDDGTILTRRPFFENLIGASVAKGNVFMDHLPYARSGIAHIKSVIDNMERINGYVSIDHYPLVVQAGMSKDGILTPWHHQLYTSLAFVSLVTLGILVFAYALMRQIRIGDALQTQLEGTQVILQKMAAEDSLTDCSTEEAWMSCCHSSLSAQRRPEPESACSCWISITSNPTTIFMGILRVMPASRRLRVPCRRRSGDRRIWRFVMAGKSSPLCCPTLTARVPCASPRKFAHSWNSWSRFTSSMRETPRERLLSASAP
ncbi:hypothetical protein KTT56_07940 [Pseudomonas viridiflava]|nr:hypothetical protein KTT56_07940 [Pseudomonas viridiflava]